MNLDWIQREQVRTQIRTRLIKNKFKFEFEFNEFELEIESKYYNSS